MVSGGFLDRLGWSARRKQVRTRSRDVLLASAVVMTCLAGVVFFQVLKLLHGPTDPFWIGYGLCLWFGFLLAVLTGMVYRRLAADS